MSNQLANIFQQASNVAITGLDEDTIAVAGNTNQSKRISIEGRLFRKIVGGKEQSVNRDDHMDVIVVKMAHEPSRTYYGGQVYKKGVKISPVCWSNDAKTPDPEVDEPCAKTCADCEFSVKGSGQGGQGTACRLSWRIALVLANDPTGDVYQLVLPATSTFGKEESGRWPFRAYVQMLANNNVSAGRVVTRMEFDLNYSVPRLLFSPVAAVDTDMLETVRDQGQTQAAQNAIKMNVYKSDKNNVREEEAPQESTPEPVKRAAKSAAPAEKAEAEDVSDILQKWSKK
jgi:hypothetical protein